MPLPTDGFNASWKVTPVRISGGGRTDWGENLPEERHDLPEALFAPGGTSEDVLLDEVKNQRGRLRWPRLQVYLQEDDQVEIRGERWQVEGTPNIWPLGTTAVLTRYKGRTS